MAIAVTNLDPVNNQSSVSVQKLKIKDMNNGTLFRDHNGLTCIITNYPVDTAANYRHYMVVQSGFIGQILKETEVELLIGNLTTFPIYEEILPMQHMKATP